MATPVLVSLLPPVNFDFSLLHSPQPKTCLPSPTPQCARIHNRARGYCRAGYYFPRIEKKYSINRGGNLVLTDGLSGLSHQFPFFDVIQYTLFFYYILWSSNLLTIQVKSCLQAFNCECSPPFFFLRKQSESQPMQRRRRMTNLSVPGRVHLHLKMKEGNCHRTINTR